jgi:hypothetical protein
MIPQDVYAGLDVSQETTSNRRQARTVFGREDDADGLSHTRSIACFTKFVNPSFASVHELGFSLIGPMHPKAALPQIGCFEI